MPDFHTITLPVWASTDEAQAWFFGFVLGAFLRIFRAGLRWFKRVGDDGGRGAD